MYSHTLRPVVSFCILFLCCQSFAQDAERAEFPQTRIDLGELILGEVVTVEIPCRNTGDAPISVKVSKLSCSSCLSPVKVEPTEIGPGTEEFVRLHLNTAGKTGGIREFVSLTSVGDKPTEQAIEIIAQPRDLLRIAPPKMAATVAFGTQAKLAVQIAANGADISLVEVRSVKDALEFSIIDGPKSGSTWNISGETRTEVYEDLLDTVVVRVAQAGRERQAEIPMPVAVIVDKPLLVQPTTILCSFGEDVSSLRKTIKVFSRTEDGTVPTLSGIEVSHDVANVLNAVIDPPVQGNSTQIELLLTRTNAISSGSVGGTLSLLFDMGKAEPFRAKINILAR